MFTAPASSLRPLSSARNTNVRFVEPDGAGVDIPAFEASLAFYYPYMTVTRIHVAIAER